MSRYKKMDPELKTKWLEALRSGKYKQGRATLKTNTKQPLFCCLGVLCEVNDPNCWHENNHYSAYQYIGTFNTSTLPDHIRKLFGFTLNGENKLIYLNDDAEFDFNQIADWIEKSL